MEECDAWDLMELKVGSTCDELNRQKPGIKERVLTWSPGATSQRYFVVEPSPMSTWEQPVCKFNPTHNTPSGSYVASACAGVVFMAKPAINSPGYTHRVICVGVMACLYQRKDVHSYEQAPHSRGRAARARRPTCRSPHAPGLGTWRRSLPTRPLSPACGRWPMSNVSEARVMASPSSCVRFDSMMAHVDYGHTFSSWMRSRQTLSASPPSLTLSTTASRSSSSSLLASLPSPCPAWLIPLLHKGTRCHGSEVGVRQLILWEEHTVSRSSPRRLLGLQFVKHIRTLHYISLNEPSSMLRCQPSS